ncbi:hypothetical protein [Gluconobacter sp.]
MQTPDTTRDVPIISLRALIIMHVMLVAFILFIHFRVSGLTDF